MSGWTPPGRCSNISWETRQQHSCILFPFLQGQLSVTLGSSVYLITPCTVAARWPPPATSSLLPRPLPPVYFLQRSCSLFFISSHPPPHRSIPGGRELCRVRSRCWSARCRMNPAARPLCSGGPCPWFNALIILEQMSCLLILRCLHTRCCRPCCCPFKSGLLSKVASRGPPAEEGASLPWADPSLARGHPAAVWGGWILVVLTRGSLS